MSQPQVATLDAWPLLSQLQRPADVHKGGVGRVLIVGGNLGMVGAALLAGRAALYGGAGYVVVGLCSPDAPVVDILHPELMLLPAHAELTEVIHATDAVAIGPGMGKDGQSRHKLQHVLTEAIRLGKRLVLDADALNLLAEDSTLNTLLCQGADPALTVMTPHPAEAARLLKASTHAVARDRLAAAQQLAQAMRCLVVLKGSGSLCVAPASCQLPAQRCIQGNAGMASAGMGDTLTGLVVALAAQGVHRGLSLWHATLLAVQLHACAADVCLLVESGLSLDQAIALQLDQSDQTPVPAAWIGVRASELIPVIRRLMQYAGVKKHNPVITSH